MDTMDPSENRGGFGARNGVLAVSYLLIAAGIFYWPVVSGKGVLFYFDLIGLNAPIRAYFFGWVARGHFPLWCPDTCAGLPLVAEGQAGPFYPPNFLVFPWLSPEIALNVSVLLHVVIALAGMFFYLRRSHSDVASVAGSIAYGFSSYLVFHLIHLSFFHAACVAPWVFFFLDRYLARGRPADVLAGALSLALVFSAGQQQGGLLVLAGVLIVVGYTAIETAVAGGKREAAEATGAVLVVVFAAGAILAVIAAGLFHILETSVRSGPMDPSFLFTGSIRPEWLPRLASPFHHGRWMDATWQLPHEVEKEIAVYLGLGAWIFAPIAFVVGGSRRDRAHLAVVGITLLLMLGEFGPFDGFFTHVPILNRMRIPPRFLLPLTVSTSFLIASGIDRLTDDRARARRVLVAAGIGALCWAGLAWGGARRITSRAVDATDPQTMAWIDGLDADLRLRTGLAVALLTVVAIAFLWRRRRVVTTCATAAIAALLFADSYTYGAAENPVVDPAMYAPRPTVEFVAERLGTKRIESLGTRAAYGAGGWAMGTAPYVSGIEALPRATNLLFGIPSAACASSLISARLDRVRENLSVPWLRRLGVRFLLSRTDVGLPVARSGSAIVHRVPKPAPLYGLAASVQPVASGDEAFARADEPRENPDDVAYVEGELDGWTADPRAGSPGSVRVDNELPDRRVLRISASARAFLIVRENYDSGWRASIDGRPQAVYRANYLFFGVPVPPGEHVVEFTYRPSYFAPALAVSGLAVLSAFGLLLIPAVRRPRSACLSVATSDRQRAWFLAVEVAVFFALVVVAVARHPSAWGL